MPKQRREPGSDEVVPHEIGGVRQRITMPGKHGAGPGESRPGESWSDPPSAPTVQAVTAGDPGRAFGEVQPLLLDGGRVGHLDVRAASVRGLSHRQLGTPRQDAYGLAVDRQTRWLVVAVADGVSAGARSHEAARLVARRGPREVAAQLDAGLTDPADIDWRALFNTLGSLILLAGRRSLGRTSGSGQEVPEPAEASPSAPDGDDRAEDEAVVKAMATTATFVVCELAPV
jgi:Protein phosphatase 2C